MPHPDLQLYHMPVNPWMTLWLGVLGSGVLEGLVAAWGYTVRQGLTLSQADPHTCGSALNSQGPVPPQASGACTTVETPWRRWSS